MWNVESHYVNLLIIVTLRETSLYPADCIASLIAKEIHKTKIYQNLIIVSVPSCAHEFFDNTLTTAILFFKSPILCIIHCNKSKD